MSIPMKRQETIHGWQNVLSYLLQAGIIIIRISMFITLVYGIFYIGRLATFIAPLPFLRIEPEAISALASALVCFISTAALFQIVSPRLKAGDYRAAALISLILGSILLLPAPFAGEFILIGSFIVLFVTEISPNWACYVKNS